MIDAISTTPQLNFRASNLPPDSEAYYNTVGFATNEMQFLSTMVSMEGKGMEKADQDLKNAIHGLT